MPEDKPRFDILGKIVLSKPEAAHYCCLSIDQFHRKAAPNLTAYDVCGKKVYRVADLKEFVEQAPVWQRSISAVKPGYSTGGRVTARSVAHLVPYANQRRKPFLKSNKPK